MPQIPHGHHQLLVVKQPAIVWETAEFSSGSSSVQLCPASSRLSQPPSRYLTTLFAMGTVLPSSEAGLSGMTTGGSMSEFVPYDPSTVHPESKQFFCIVQTSSISNPSGQPYNLVRMTALGHRALAAAMLPFPPPWRFFYYRPSASALSNHVFVFVRSSLFLPTAQTAWCVSNPNPLYPTTSQ
ncbi:hypothetical protein BO82DRAFT_365215 [Aspergillus uvarum CBS 121591]|uniref:Uncharacterized protein n=1 Tax=Aspergillus uvarum CBS 121591 TaxID=1448315 RepID=A0A319CC43_9EURO|nr:hypothetical protein BO82DRAFT_365215 [Aspergillus uvarum CBS 121591]PYH81331.1 hypothetical protein BO82DRAFT_365215 [Aspergillus uvarum CBS 121591]